MLLVLIALVFAVGSTATPTPAAPPTPAKSQLPATQPGLSKDEGVFLLTSVDDGQPIIYFIAQNTRHTIQNNDLQVERQLNPLWPVRGAEAEEVLAYVEGAPIGVAKTGLLLAHVALDGAPDVADSPSFGGPTTAASVHVVGIGDDLIRLSSQYGTDVAAIQQANGLANPDRIVIGQSLVIPASVTTEVVAVAADVSPSPDDTTAAAPTPAQYTVQAGDSAFLIARRFSVAQSDLLVANHITNPNRVYTGQVLEIPGY